MVDFDCCGPKQGPENWPILQRLLNHADIDLNQDDRGPYIKMERFLLCGSNPRTPASLAHHNNLSLEKMAIDTEVRQSVQRYTFMIFLQDPPRSRTSKRVSRLRLFCDVIAYLLLAVCLVLILILIGPNENVNPETDMTTSNVTNITNS